MEFSPCSPCGFGATRDDGPANWFHTHPPSPGPLLTVTDPSPFFAATLRTSSSEGARPGTEGAPTAPRCGPRSATGQEGHRLSHPPTRPRSSFDERITTEFARTDEGGTALGDRAARC